MSDTAAHLVDRVLLPEACWRQFVFTFPPELAIGLCFRARLADRVLNACIRALFAHHRRRARHVAGTMVHPTSVTWIQRFSDGAGSWYHLHVLTPDGLFRSRRDELAVAYEPHPPPSSAEVHALVVDTAARVARAIRRHDRSSDAPILERCAAQHATAIRRPTPPPSRARPVQPLQARYQGFSVHAATAVPAHDSAALERLVRYLRRPAVPQERLNMTPDGRVRFTLKRPRRGVTHLLFEPTAFLARLAALVPPPHQNQVRYHGPLSSASPLRRYVVPVPPDPRPPRPTAPQRPKRMTRANLLMRTLAVDVNRCRCGGRFATLQVVKKPNVIQAILAAITLSQQPRPPP